ncbi:MAG: hypothetical protein JO323_08795 [Acidobacteriia bacterium]|nr:hypothetical protein [Terriglobia bacterium]
MRQKTGWQVSLEEPVWAVSQSAGPDVRVTETGLRVQPPVADQIQLSIPTLRSSTPSAAIGALLGAFNAQNASVAYKVESVGNMAILEADTMQKPSGAQVTAPLILSTVVQVPIGPRTLLQHLEALMAAVQQQTGVSTRVDTAGFGFQLDVAFTGKNGPVAQTQDYLVDWGAASQPARTALLDLLSHSLTTTVYELTCQIGIGSPGECTLSLSPLTVDVTGRSGHLKKKTLYFDRGRPDVPQPPDPD